MSRVHTLFTLLSLAAASPALDLSCPVGETCSDQPSAPEPEQLVADTALDEVFMLQLSTNMPTLSNESLSADLAEQPAGFNVSAAFSQLDGLLSEERAQGEVRLADRMGKKAKKSAATVMPANYTTFGDSECECIGINNIDGFTAVFMHEEIVKYPADLGARCYHWDKDSHPLCKGEISDELSWCGQPWCYVDPCNCEINKGSVPRISSYLTGAQWQGNGLFFSYPTCGGVDTYTSWKGDTFCVNQKSWDDCTAISGCEWTLSGTCVGTEVQGTGCGNTATEAKDESVWGLETCKCIGIDGKNGTTEVEIYNGTYNYPGDLGSTCYAWDDGFHPDCTGPGPKADFCESKWCYIDPCQCTISPPPKTITYLPGATFQGSPLYYSYSTCGNIDVYTETGNPTACVNQLTTEDCAAQGSKCIWTSASTQKYGWKGCVGRALATRCSFKLEGAYGGCSRSSLRIALVSVFCFIWSYLTSDASRQPR